LSEKSPAQLGALPERRSSAPPHRRIAPLMPSPSCSAVEQRWPAGTVRTRPNTPQLSVRAAGSCTCMVDVKFENGDATTAVRL